MVSIIIPVLQNENNTELRYVLRSIEKHLKGYGEVFLVGHKPNWCKNLTLLPFTDNSDKTRKELNIHSKLLLACRTKEVSEEFLYFTDDTYLLQDFNAETFPAHYKSTLYDTMKKNCGTYRASCNHTRKYLLERGLETKDFDVHSPHLLNKHKYLELMEGINFDIDNGYVIKSLYFNQIRTEGEFTTDCKIRKSSVEEIWKRLEGRSFFSTAKEFPEVVEVLQSLYGSKSIYES